MPSASSVFISSSVSAESRTISVIDGHSLMHRAFHAVPPTMNAPDGTPTNAIFGFLSMLLKFIDTVSPDAIVCAFDDGRPAFRMHALEQYKAQRPRMDDGLRVQFPLMEEVLESLGIPCVRIKGWEGDDILGTIAARDEQLGYRTLLVTGDRDAYQLASEFTRIVTTKKGITDVEIYGPAEVVERFGITPAQIPDYLGLKGDSSDNIPGVPGIGEKTASKLLREFGTLEGVYDNLDKLKGKMLENLQNNREAAFVSREVATIIRDLDFPLDLEGLRFPSFTSEAVKDAFGKLRLATHLGKVLKLIGEGPLPGKSSAGKSSAGIIPGASVTIGASGAGTMPSANTVPATTDSDSDSDSPNFAPIPSFTGKEACDLLEAALVRGEELGVALEEDAQATLFDTPVVLAVSTTEGVAVFEGEDIPGALKEVVRRGSFAALGVKSLVQQLFPPDTAQQAGLSEQELMDMRAFDLELAAYILDSSSSSYGYADLFARYLNGVLPDEKTLAARASFYAQVARLLIAPLKAALVAGECERPYYEIDLPLVAVLAIMERTGTAIDAGFLQELGQRTQLELEGLSKQIIALAGEDFNLDSPKQLSRILFEVLGLKPLKKTKSGFSTDASVLKELAKEHGLPALILRYRELAKIKSTYIDALPRMRAGDGRVHTSFNAAVTTTGRLSSSNPNLQNIPVRTEFGRQIRKSFLPLEEGQVFLSADYSQIELRLLAHLSGDQGLIDAFASGEDFHTETAARVFAVPREEVTPRLRSRAKAVNFGIVYGQQAFGLAQSLDIPMGEAKEMIDRYFQIYPGVRAYLDETVEEAKRLGYATTLFGRRRYLPDLRMPNQARRAFGERTAMNHPMQGSAADIIKLAMTEVQKRLLEGGYESRLLLQVHDELDFSVPEDEIEKLSVLVRDVMENIVRLRVSLDVDISQGANWAEAH